jgi:glycosyltransferase involved in cell wall biosynthesis
MPMSASTPGLRILYIIDGLGPGGAERSLAALAPHYRDLGVKLDVAVLFEREGFQDEVRGSGAQIFSFADRTSRLARTQAVRSLIREVRPDLVHTTLFEADVTGRIAARLAHTPVVSSLVNEAYGPEHFEELGVRTSRLRAARLLDTTTARLTRRMHAVSEQVARVMAARLHYPPSRITVVPRGRDPETLGRRSGERRAAARADLGISDDEVVVLGVGRHEPQKALEVLVEATANARVHVPQLRLLVAGREGAATQGIEEQIRASEATDVVTLLGGRTDVPDLLCAADVFVLTSRREGMPGAVIEAMALEVPIVATDLPQVREVTGESGALLAPVDDVETFSRAMVRSIGDADGARRRVRYAYQRFCDEFTVANTARQMVAFYEEALA